MSDSNLEGGHDWESAPARRPVAFAGGVAAPPPTTAPPGASGAARDTGSGDLPTTAGRMNPPPLTEHRRDVAPAHRKFEVTVWTTNINNAGTKCPIYITFRGDKGDSGPHLLVPPVEKRKRPTDLSTYMSRGIASTFAPVDVSAIGHLTSIRIGVAMDLTGPDAVDAWNCLRVLVKADGLELPDGKYDCCAWIGPRDEFREEKKDLEEQLRGSAASAAPLRASAAGLLAPPEEERVLRKDHDGYQAVHHPKTGAKDADKIELTWFWRELLPVRWFKPETPLERKKQNDAAPREFATMPDPEEIKVIGPDPIDFQEHREKMATLERPSWRKPPPPPLNKVWLPVTTHVSAEEAAQQELKEREAFTNWLRNDNAGGVVALAKKLNKSRSYVENKLRHFQTTNQVHRYYVPPSPPSTIATRPPTARAENRVNPVGGLMPQGAVAPRLGTGTSQLGASRGMMMTPGARAQTAPFAGTRQAIQPQQFQMQA